MGHPEERLQQPYFGAPLVLESSLRWGCQSINHFCDLKRSCHCNILTAALHIFRSYCRRSTTKHIFSHLSFSEIFSVLPHDSSPSSLNTTLGFNHVILLALKKTVAVYIWIPIIQKDPCNLVWSSYKLIWNWNGESAWYKCSWTENKHENGGNMWLLHCLTVHCMVITTTLEICRKSHITRFVCK